MYAKIFKSYNVQKREQQCCLIYYILYPSPIKGGDIVCGLSHGLIKCPPDTRLPCYLQGRPFESHQAPKKESSDAALFFGARDGTRTHTAKPHAPQTCLSTIPTLSQVTFHIISATQPFVNIFLMFPQPKAKEKHRFAAVL